MAIKNTACTTVDKTQTAKVDPNTGKTLTPGKCPGDIIPVEAMEGVRYTIAGKVYDRYEYCQRCGQIFPG